MAGPVIKFTERKREKFAKFVGFTQWVCILPSFMCLVLALYVQLVIEDKINFIEDYNGTLLPGFLLFCGFFGLFSHILCGKVAYTNRLPEKREKWMKFLLPALIVTFVIFLAELISGVLCFAHIQNLEESFQSGIKAAMSAYKDDATTKEELDILQFEYECCGSKDYMDWFSVTWIHPDFRSTKSRTSDLNKTVIDSVPFSCCNPQTLRPCIQHHVHDNNLHFNYDYRKETTLYNNGCTEKLMSFYKHSVLMVAGGLVFILSSIEFELIICMRLLQTAVASSLESYDQEGPSYGYLFGNPQKTDADTTFDSTGGTTLLDTTGETTTADITFSMEDGEFDERYVNLDPVYENVGQFEVGADDEHIYNEGAVEGYLAGKFARSKERFEHLQEGGYEAVHPAYMAPGIPVAPPPPPLPNVNFNRSPTNLHEVRSNYGSYLAMDFSNSSWAKYLPATEKVPKRDRKHNKVRVKRHPFPSPKRMSSSPKDTSVINMRQSKSPSKSGSGTRQRHTEPERRRLLDSSPPDLLYRSPNRYQNREEHLQEPRRSLFEPHCSYKHSATQISPNKILPYDRNSNIFPSMFNSVYGKRKSPQKKSPDRRISPQKTSFKSGVSYKCNHAYD